MENVEISLDPETEFLYSKEGTGNEWELFKENVRPLKRGRNVRLLNDALKSQTDHQLKKSLLHNRRKMVEAIDEYKGDDPLKPWLECIKWVQEAFPPGGDCSGLVVIYEQCVRTFWHEDRYKDDLRYLKVWLEYAENCADAEVIYSFLEANKIGQTHSIFFISYALHMESKNKIKTANEIFNTGISRDAQPIEKLKAAYKKFLGRSMGRPKPTDEDLTENRLAARSFGTVLARGETRNQIMESSDFSRKKMKQDRAYGTPLNIYKDTNATLFHQLELSEADSRSWYTLGSRKERNKENNAIPTKWTSNKIPRRAGHITGGATASACIDIFVDEECAENHKVHSEGGKSSTLLLRQGDGQDLKKETELLRENPLRNFPPICLPR
ncbi:mitotic spindle checkpoint protein BUBR1 isoform X1 [Actinidia eriantha]|uniref:mitotic spindle checkpoint protein BUBR1 isoform X1 n=1 Tax=Actinidia eriantha TaxID=165200 RepID=UPI0025872196|nr:mitotic spindle checkpoint protein BUBR1 isoform X1 [Actinidia eriantha]XP_057502799.1 mitotic spindle checkpoint protein BUBR1 isoform X1 [Actinidia eriantha]XP_057502800.1 mitotic spindle checkpoint protein BUBR1 isoform X1 [Actinidia eriantha]